MAPQIKRQDNTDTFVNITNQDIYNEIKSIKSSVMEVNEGIIKTNERIESNCGRINTMQKLILGSYGFSMSILGFLIAHILD